MSFCGKCGAQISNEVKFCPTCGAEITEEQTQTQQSKNVKNQFENTLNKLNNTEESTADYEKNDIEQNKVMAILSYIGILVFIPIFAAPKSKFARYHSNQGLVLLISEILYGFVYRVLCNIIFAISWRLGFMVSFVNLIGIVFFILAIIGIINAANGKAKELPVIGKIKILK
jgi:uncharacterized membrane protein